MATLKLHQKKIKHNYEELNKLFHQNKIEWGIVTKLLCGYKPFLEEILKLGIKQVCDSRVTNLKHIKEINPKIETIYIKPPASKSIKNIVKFADISLNTELETIKLLSKEAIQQKKVHKIIIMIEMGDLREGISGKKLLSFYSKIFKLKGIKVLGIGTNLNCLHGVMPSADKLLQLSLYKNIIELKFNEKLKLISGGSTVTIPLIYKKLLPSDLNHFRVGEALYFGANLFTGKTLKGFYSNVFELEAQIIELANKPMLPYGELKENPSGEMFKEEEELYGKFSNRAILDLGLLDVHPKFLTPLDKNIKILGASSDMIVVDLGENKKKYQVSSIIKFNITYMGVLSLMSSDYIDKVLE